MSGSHEVGYGKPPKDKQFKKGQSGNPKGRPKKTKDLEKLFDAELSQTIRITEGGVTRIMTKREALVKEILHSALKGDHRARLLVMKIAQNHVELDSFTPDPADEKAFIDFIEQYKNSQGGNDDSAGSDD